MKWEGVPEEERRSFAKWLGVDGIKQSIQRFHELATTGETRIDCASCVKSVEGREGALSSCSGCKYPKIRNKVYFIDRCCEFGRGKFKSRPVGVTLRYPQDIYSSSATTKLGKDWCAEVAQDYRELLELLEDNTCPVTE